MTAIANSACTYFFEKVAIWYLSLYFKKRDDKLAMKRFENAMNPGDNVFESKKQNLFVIDEVERELVEEDLLSSK